MGVRRERKDQRGLPGVRRLLTFGCVGLWRRLFTLLAAASLLLCAAAGGAWLASYWVIGSRDFSVSGVHWVVQSDRGSLLLMRLPPLTDSELKSLRQRSFGGGVPMTRRGARPQSLKEWLFRSGDPPTYRLVPIGVGDYGNYQILTVAGQLSYALVVPLTSPFPTVWAALAVRRRRRRRKGLCASCGYDVRATPGRCPECGKEPVIS
jgi:hypothetical protein